MLGSALLSLGVAISLGHGDLGTGKAVLLHQPPKFIPACLSRPVMGSCMGRGAGWWTVGPLKGTCLGTAELFCLEPVLVSPLAVTLVCGALILPEL